MVKGISINVGSNSQNMNGRGLIDPVDLTFQYLPIPEEEPVNCKVPSYADLNLKNMNGLKYPNHFVHLDPEFMTNTYGHVKRGYGDIKAILNLNKRDYLFFHATLSHPNTPDLWLTAIIAYFIVENVYDCSNLTKDEIIEQYGKQFLSNAHLKRVNPSVDFLICGSNESKLLQYAIPLSSFSNPRQLDEKFKENITTVTGKHIDDGKPWFRWTLKVNKPQKLLREVKL